MRRAAAIAIACVPAALPPAAAASPLPGPPAYVPPEVHQMVVFRSGAASVTSPRAKRVTVRVHGRRCIVPAGTPLAALVVSQVARLRMRDFSHCSRLRERDSASLFVSGIGPDLNAGQDGWTYKVGRKAGTTGAADPSGPFGHARLRTGAHVLWFYCHLTGSSCQRTLSFTQISTSPPGAVVVHVGAYNDDGRGIPAAGATVHVDQASGVTGPDGAVKITAGVGPHTMYAEEPGRVRTFATRVVLQ
jgi:hypothetical protein